MILAKKLKKKNIAEYLLYMWQIEDIIRANDFNIEKIDKEIISKYEISDDEKKECREWYEGLIAMMGKENIIGNGHLVINKNIISELTELHNKLLKTPKETEYISSYYNSLPFIVELRAKSNDKDIPEIETCFSALYGLLLMRLQKKEISGETQAAITQISSLLRNLSIKYKMQEQGTDIE